MLSSWTLEIRRCEKGEDEILGTLAAGITPRQEVDEMLIAIAPKKQARQTISMPPPTVEEGENLSVASFVGSARVKRKCEACTAIYVDYQVGRLWLPRLSSSLIELSTKQSIDDYFYVLIC